MYHHTHTRSPPERDRTGQAEREGREGQTDVSRETRDSETGQTGAAVVRSDRWAVVRWCQVIQAAL